MSVSPSGVNDPNAKPGKGGASGGDRCLVIHPHVKSREQSVRDPHACLEEIAGLARAISLDIVHSEVVPVANKKPATFIGGGAVERLGEIIKGNDIFVTVVDAQLSPVQQRNLEKAWNCKVVDRTGLILEIFGERARTKEGVMQVELARLTYERSRLVRTWTHLERQRGGTGKTGGPGETQIEIDRRLIDQRLRRLRQDLSEVKRTRALHRTARKKVPYPIVALVGYTNAGKSTLFNRVTAAEVMAKDQLFATLDPTMRSLRLPSGRQVILSDTVGFISDLPHELVESFHATLEEVQEADVVVHVRDISHPDTQAQKADVDQVLAELGIKEERAEAVIEVLNKTDLIEAEELDIQRNQASRSLNPVVLASAVTGDGLDDLFAAIDFELSKSMSLIEVTLEPHDGATMAWLYGHGEVVERADDDDGIHLKVRLDAVNATRFEQKRANG